LFDGLSLVPAGTKLGNGPRSGGSHICTIAKPHSHEPR
jgi:hypothetical protein